MIYINFVDLHSLMLRAKFQKHIIGLLVPEKKIFYRFLLFIPIVAILVM